MENEIFKYVIVDGHVNLKYKVSNFGSVINVEKNNKLVKLSPTVGGYLVCGIDGKCVNVHKLVMNTFIGADRDPKKICCDHINGNGFDNRIINLRWCNYQENGANKKIRPDRGYKGVYYNPKYGNYVAKVSKNGRSYYLGTFQDLRSAKIAYNEKAIELFGEFAKLNDI